MSNQGRSGGKGGTWDSGSKSRSGNKSGNHGKRKSPQNEQRNKQDKARQVSSPESREASGAQTPTFDNNSGNRSKPNQEPQPFLPPGTPPKAPFNINKSSNEEEGFDQKLSSKNIIRERIKGFVNTLEKVDPETSSSEKLSNSSSAPLLVTTGSGTFQCISDPPDPNESHQSDSKNACNWNATKQDKAENSVGQSCIKEIEGNLFNAPDDVSLAHCVGADLRMGSGIAVKFYEKFQSLGELMDQRAEPGGVAFIRYGHRHVFYLITKRSSKEKPTLNTMRQSLLALRDKCKTLNVTELAMPQIGCGLDGLAWRDVKRMLEEIFANGFVITIYNLDRGFVDKPTAGSKSMVKNENLMLKDIEPETGLLYIGCAEHYESEEMKSINEKCRFLSRLKLSTYELGTTFRTRLNSRLSIYGLICKRSANSRLSYKHLESAISRLKEHNKRDNFMYFGIQAFVEKDDPYVMEKIATLFRNSLIDAEFWICWPPSLVYMRPSISEQNDEAMQYQESSSTGDPQSSSSHPSDFPKQSKDWENNEYTPEDKSKWDNAQRNTQSQDYDVREVETKMKTQSLADESKSGTSTFDSYRSEPAIDASNTSEMELSDDNLLANISAPVDSANTAEDDEWPDESQWQTHAEDEKRKSLEKKDAIRQNKEKERQERKSVKPKSCVTECKGDLFDSPDTMCLAHCVGADLRMGSGIAVLFRQKFGKVEELLDQRVRQGGVAFIQDSNRWIFYLVTKRESTGKPTYDTLESSLQALHKKCKELKVTELAMPRIGCGLDRLEWDRVKEMLEDIFADGFSIKIYNLEKEYKETKQSMPKTTIKNEVLHLKDIQPGTGLLYIASVEPVITDEMKSLDEKYHFVQRLDKTKPKLGTVVYTQASYPREGVYGLVCRKSPNDPLSFVHLKAALKQLRKLNETHKYFYFGIQAFKERGDDYIMGKIETMLRYSYIKAEAWICFPPSLEHLMSRSSSPSFSDHISGGGRSSWGETDNRRMFTMLRDMQRMQESTYRKLITLDDIGNEIYGPEGLKAIGKQTTAQMIEIVERMDALSSKTDHFVQSFDSFYESYEDLQRRVTTLETTNHDLEERVEFLEQRLLMPPSSAGPSFNVNGSYPHPGLPDGPLPLLQGPTVQQVCHSPSHYFDGRMHVVPPAYPNNRQIFASQVLPAEKEALIRAAKKFARANNYEIIVAGTGYIHMRRDDRHPWTTIDSRGDLNFL